MNFLFLLKYTHILGGVETLAVRMSRWLVSHGHTVIILSNRIDKSGDSLFDKRVRLLSHEQGQYALGCSWKVKKICKKLNIPRPDLIKGFDPESCWEASVLSQAFTPSPKVIAGVYLPTVSTTSTRLFRETRQKMLLQHFEKRLNRNNRLFISDEQLENYRKERAPLMEGHVWPLAVDVGRFTSAQRQPRKGSLVSIGRLSPMKEYNLYMVDVVARLVRSGLDVTWDVYGDGPDEEHVKNLIHESGMEDRIRLHGRLPYDRFQDALLNAYIFVGMGTAAVEAAACGVPVVVAIAHDPTGMTYGRISRLPMGNIGDRMIRPPHLFVEDEIKAILELTPQHYAREAEIDRAAALQYDMEQRMQHFMDIVERATPCSPNAILKIAYSAHLRIEQARLCLSRKREGGNAQC